MGWLALAVAGCVVALDQSVTFTEPVERIEVELASGDVTVLAEPGPARLEGTFVGPSGDGDLVVLRDGVLRVAAGCGSCAGSVELWAPRGTSIDVATGAGAVEVEGFDAAVGARIDVGSVAVSGHGLGRVDVSVRTGDAEVERHERADTLVDVGTGDADVRVPAGAWDLELHAADLDLGPGLVADPDGPTLTVGVRRGSADVRAP